MLKKTQDKKRYYYQDYVKRSNKLRWTFILVTVLFVSDYLFIFHCQNMDEALSAMILMACIGLPIVVAMLWIDFGYKKWWQKIPDSIIMILIALPSIFLIEVGRSKYEQYHLQKYKTYTTGVVTNTYSQYNSRSGTTSYLADITYKFNYGSKTKAFYMHHDEYKTGDSVIVIYSSVEPAFSTLVGKK